MLHTSFVEIGPPIPEKILRDLEIYGHGGHLGHVASIMSIIFISLYLKAYTQNFVQNSLWFLIKASFNFHM